MEQNGSNIKEYIGKDNIISFYFKQENGKHLGFCHIKCLNASMNKIFISKSSKIASEYVEFVAHFKSMDGSNAPTRREFTRLGVNAITTALVNMVEAF